MYGQQTIGIEGHATMKPAVLQFGQRDVSATGWKRFRRALLGALNRGAPILVIDLSDVRFIFSGVLNALVEARVRVRTCGGRLVLIVNRRELSSFIETTGFDGLFDVVESEEEALELLSV